MLWAIATTDGFMGALAAFAAASGLVTVVPVSWLAWISPTLASLANFAKPLALAALFALGVTVGHRIADEHAELLQARFDRDWAQNELRVQRDVAAAASQLATEAQQHADDVDKTVEAYEEYLSTLPAGDACRLDDHDVDSLRNIGSRPVKPNRSSPSRLRSLIHPGSPSAH